jgi:hypothetical protein
MRAVTVLQKKSQPLPHKSENPSHSVSCTTLSVCTTTYHPPLILVRGCSTCHHNNGYHVMCLPLTVNLTLWAIWSWLTPCLYIWQVFLSLFATMCPVKHFIWLLYLVGVLEEEIFARFKILTLHYVQTPTFLAAMHIHKVYSIVVSFQLDVYWYFCFIGLSVLFHPQTPFVRQNTPHPKELKAKAHKLFGKGKTSDGKAAQDHVSESLIVNILRTDKIYKWIGPKILINFLVNDLNHTELWGSFFQIRWPLERACHSFWLN